ncbi:hypothetical protein AB4Y96_09395 [Phyllobacterium sp. TAF24]|uniref:gp53-like domain-containing protein n=1 Tax=Phyllobacterium sp. TAF24 TaxID=3233068 RepID=UPI003F9A6A8B
MADNPDITAGTASVTVGTKIVTGVGTFWSTDEIRAGDLFASDGYPGARIDTVNSDTSITLKDNWRGATLPAGSSYYIRWQPDSSRYSVMLAAVRKILTQPLLTAFAGLTAATDTIAYFTGSATMATVAFKAWARSFLGLTMASDKLPYGTGTATMALTDFTAAGRASVNIAGTAAADKLPYLNGASSATLTDLTSYARTLLDDANASAAQTTLGISTFIKTLIAATDGNTALAALGITKSLLGNGYYRFPSGLIVQWGSVNNAATDFAQPFPIAFPTICAAVSCMTTYNPGTPAFTYQITSSNVISASFDARCRVINAGSVTAQGNLPFIFMAVGF